MAVHLFIALGDADGLEAPYLVEVTALDIVVDRVGGVVRVAGDLCACVGDVEGGSV